MRVTTACILAILLPAALTGASPRRQDVALSTHKIVGKCQAKRPRLADADQVRVFRNPREFPPADLHHAIDRRVDNCPVPAIVRRNVGH